MDQISGGGSSGFGLRYSEPGHPGIVFDVEVCLRAWSQGWQVGLYNPLGFDRNVGGRGTHMFDTDSGLKRNTERNRARLRQTYGVRFQELNELAAAANRDAGLITLPHRT